MRRSLRWSVMFTITLLATVCACDQPCFDVKAMRDAVAARAPEIDRLEMFIGSWQTEGELRMTGTPEVFRGVGTNHVTWDADRQFVVERYTIDWGDFGRMSGLTLWTYDPRGKVYRWWRVGSYGGVGDGTATYDEATHTWTLKSHGRNIKTGHSSVSDGTIRMDADHAMEWTWLEWDDFHMLKFAEFKGRSHRSADDAKSRAAGPLAEK